MAIWSISANYASVGVFTDCNFVLFGAAFGPRTSPLFGWQARKLYTINQQLSLWLYTKLYYRYVCKFFYYGTFNVCEVLEKIYC